MTTSTIHFSGSEARRFAVEDRVWLAIALYLAIAIVIGVPLAMIVLWSFSDGWFPPSLIPEAWTLQHWREVLDDSTLASAVARSFIIAVIVTILSGIVAFPTA